MDECLYLLKEYKNELDIVPRHPSFPITQYSWRELKEDPKKNWIVERETRDENPRAIISCQNSSEAHFRAYENAIKLLKLSKQKCFKFFKSGGKEGKLVYIAEAFEALVENHPDMADYMPAKQLTQKV